MPTIVSDPHEAQHHSVPNPYRQEPSPLDQIRNVWATICDIGYNKEELLDYDYTYDVIIRGRPQPPPRERERGEMYIDSFNSDSWSCSFGTKEENGTWMNSSDQAGTIMAALVWLLMLYSCVTVLLLTATQGIPAIAGMAYCVLCFMALASHAKTSLTDPGTVPKAAVPCETQRQTQISHSMCGQCQTFKPPASHHCRICNRCVSRMDHHCPWMNNCVGAGNLSTYNNYQLTYYIHRSLYIHLMCDTSLKHHRALFLVFGIHLDMFRICLVSFWLELFPMFHGCLYVSSHCCTSRQNHDDAVCRFLSIYIQHADECHLRHHDWYWYH